VAESAAIPWHATPRARAEIAASAFLLAMTEILAMTTFRRGLPRDCFVGRPPRNDSSNRMRVTHHECACRITVHGSRL